MAKPRKNIRNPQRTNNENIEQTNTKRARLCPRRVSFSTIADFNKMEPSREGPYTIARVHANGTVTIQKGLALQRINIRQCTPYVESQD
jgi:hypothetical protein